MRVIQRHTPAAALGEAGLANPGPTNKLRRHWYRTPSFLPLSNRVVGLVSLGNVVETVSRPFASAQQCRGQAHCYGERSSIWQSTSRGTELACL